MESLENILPDIATMEILSESFQNLFFSSLFFYFLSPPFFLNKTDDSIFQPTFRSLSCEHFGHTLLHTLPTIISLGIFLPFFDQALAAIENLTSKYFQVPF